MEIAKDLFYIFSMIASTLFSLFMMYSMYKTKKGVEKIANTSVKFTEEISKNINKILPALGIPLPIDEPTEVFRPLNEEEKTPFYDEGIKKHFNLKEEKESTNNKKISQ